MNILSSSACIFQKKTVICYLSRFSVFRASHVNENFLHDEKITPMGGTEKEGDGRDRLRRRVPPCNVQIVYRFLATSYE